MKAKILSLAALVCAAALPAHAETQGSGWYGEAGYTFMALKGEGHTDTPSLARFVVGKEVTNNFSVEAMYGTTVAKASPSGGKISAGFSGLYIKPFANLTTDTSFFGRLGYASSDGKFEANSGTSSSWSMSKASYGLGIQTQFTKDIYGAIDYMNYGKKTFENGTSVTHSGITASIGMRF